jgi:hypothetical protein
MVIVSVAVPVPPALVALMDAAVTATVEGVPVIRPVSGFNTNGEGKPTEPKLVGVLVAVIW